MSEDLRARAQQLANTILHDEYCSPQKMDKIVQLIFDNLCEVSRAAYDQRAEEAFTRGRNWELNEFQKCITTHNPPIPGLCSWCKTIFQSKQWVFE